MASGINDIVRNYLDKAGAEVLIDQLKQYVKSSKQIFEFTTYRNFPQPGKVGNLYLDTTAHTIWIYDIDIGYIEFSHDYIRHNDNILIDCGDANNIIIGS